MTTSACQSSFPNPKQETTRLLAVRLSSLGDLVHTLPVIPALRMSLPALRLDWIVDRRWAPLMRMTEGVDEVISWDGFVSVRLAGIRRLREARYSCALDFQGNYRSALLTWLCGAGRRIGRARSAARQPGASRFYSECLVPAGQHIAEMNLSLAARAGARQAPVMQFPLRVPESERHRVRQILLEQGIGPYLVMNPGGGWKSKCWPPERYGVLCAEFWASHRIRSVINVAPGEQALGDAVVRAAGSAKPLVFSASLPQLAALLADALVVVAADTGPVHLAAALGTRVVALFGPTSPSRNGPLPRGLVLQNAPADTHDHKRGNYGRRGDYSPAMLSITVDQAAAAVEGEMILAQRGRLQNPLNPAHIYEASGHLNK